MEMYWPHKNVTCQDWPLKLNVYNKSYFSLDFNQFCKFQNTYICTVQYNPDYTPGFELSRFYCTMFE